MNPDAPIILLVEDSVDVGLVTEHIVLMSLPECRLVWARSMEEAWVRLCGLPIAVFLIDVVLPDGNGIDFLMEAAKTQPNARAVVMTGNPLPDYKERSKKAGALRFLEKPVAMEHLVECLREAVAAHTQQSLESARSFQGTLKDLTPIDILQLKCMANSSCVILFRAAGENGRVYFQKGEIVHAEAGELTGEEALNKIVGFTGGNLLEEVPKYVPRTLHADWQTLLMNAAHAQDVRAQMQADGTLPE